MTHPLKQLVIDQKRGNKRGITAICSANTFVLQAAMENAKLNDEFVLIEATANQVNQFGGYTGMKPKDFVAFVEDLANQCDFDTNKLILGGDHLGPLTWQNENEKTAMENASELIRQYVAAGFTKIHIDTSMRVVDDDKNAPLTNKTIARRAAMLCATAEDEYEKRMQTTPQAIAPVYVIGSEVPIPGGAQEEENEQIQITKADDFRSTVQAFKDEYDKLNLQKAWDRVIAVVVQPGVEFGDAIINEYDRKKAKDLTRALNEYPGLVFEGHSTDYQTRDKLRSMVEDSIAILKVGPALTFALREALFSLELIEKEMLANTGAHLSNFKEVLENEMLKHPEHWKKHYGGMLNELQLKMRYSFSDRSRYYLPTPELIASIQRLVNNLSETKIPLVLLSQYMPIQYLKVRQGELPLNPECLIMDRIGYCINEYAYGCGRSDIEV